MWRFLLPNLLIFLLSLAASPAAAARAALAPVEAMIAHPSVVHAGPGDTYLKAGELYPGDSVNIVERNWIGNWLRVQYTDPASSTETDGWVLTGTLQLAPDFRLSDVLVNNTLPDADLNNITDEALAALYRVPVVPTISAAMDEVFRRGQALGNAPNVITKVGDSLSAHSLYLSPLSEGNYDLGPYDYLADTAKFFARSLATHSAAARIGLTTFSVFDPAWSGANCQPDEPPLACEYRLKQPSVAFIMFGANDVGLLTDEQYDAHLRQIVDETLARGIIPVLSTFTAHPDADTWPRALRFNRIVVQVADDYDVPLINLWAAARALPGYGLGDDHAHLTVSGERINFATGYEALYGVSLQNLLSLVTLDEIRRVIIR
ncbi:MAG: hypothetical protein HZC41_27015 [Chloroflexi bacterium]|nr:hypothetical protein [Chloroflexota bacterium]